MSGSISVTNIESLLEERKHLLKAIEQNDALLKALGHRSPVVTESSKQNPAPHSTQGTKPSQFEAIKKSCASMETNITTPGMTEWLRANGYPEAKSGTVGLYLSRLKKLGFIKATGQVGDGNANIYAMPGFELL